MVRRSPVTPTSPLTEMALVPLGDGRAASHSSVISLVGFKIKYPDRFSNPQALIEINRWSTALDTSLALTSAMLVVSIGAEIYQYRLVRRAQQTVRHPIRLAPLLRLTSRNQEYSMRSNGLWVCYVLLSSLGSGLRPQLGNYLADVNKPEARACKDFDSYEGREIACWDFADANVRAAAASWTGKNNPAAIEPEKCWQDGATATPSVDALTDGLIKNRHRLPAGIDSVS